MSMRTRKLVGTILILVFIAVYAFAAMMVAIALQVGASKLVELLYYLVAGLLWTVPVALLIRWMHRPDASPGA